MKNIDQSKTLFLIDGSSFLYRAYYSLRPLHAPSGEPVQAVYGFCRMLKKLIDDFKPRYMVLTWDSKGPTRRHEAYPAYKATRQAPPSDLFEQKKYIQEFADLIGLKQLAVPGLEADDLMHSLALDAQKAGNEVMLITSDKDMGQLLSPSIFLFDPAKDQFVDESAFAQKYGFEPQKLPFYFAIVGDSSDNIPGVRGIGDKGATQLVQQFASLEDLYNNLDKVTKDRTRLMLQEQKESAFLSRDLFLLLYEPLGLSMQDCAFDSDNWYKARPLFEALAFKSLLKGLVPTAQNRPLLSQEKGYSFICVTNLAQLQELQQLILKHTYVALDTESDGLSPFEHTLAGISLCVQEGTAYYVPFGHKNVDGTIAAEQLSKDQVFEYLKPLLENPAIHKVLHHVKHDYLMLYNAGIDMKGVVFDTLVAASLVTLDWESASLKELSLRYFNERMSTYQEVVKDKKLKDFSYVSLADATEYSAADAHQTFKLVPLLNLKLREYGMHELYATIEFPLIHVLCEMEKEGIYCDQAVLQELDAQVSRDLQILRDDIIALIGPEYKDINLNSPKQLESLLFTHLLLPTMKKSDKRTGYSTDSEVLQQLSKLHPVPGLILKYRELFKLKSTYIDALPEYINKRTGKIHTTFSQTSVATGRLASYDPNLQNIPVDSAYDIRIRSAFKPDPGYIFISADYSQIELRVLAYFSQDKNLMDAFLSGQDIHARTAAGLFDVPLAQVTHEQRQIGKRINFSILYGLTPFGLSKDLNIPLKDARHYIEKYFAQYPQVSSWMESVIEETKKYGYVTTLWGRRRAVPGIYEQNRVLYDLAKRIAINTKAQGTAAEVMKLGMVALQNNIEKQGLSSKILLQIHDELLLQVPLKEQAHMEQLIKNTLESVVDWNVPLEVSLARGFNWHEVTK